MSLLLLAAVVLAIRIGLSKALIEVALNARSVPVAARAVNLTVGDTEAYFARAAVLRSTGETAASVEDFARAVSLRPRDYYVWLELGLARDELDDPSGALEAFSEGVRLAPFYAQPHWLRGNLLLRLGRYEEAFDDLRKAAESNPDLMASLIDLAWSLSKADPVLTADYVQVNSERMHLAFARFLAGKGHAREALTHFQAAGAVTADIRRELLQELFNTHSFAEAFAVWRQNHAGAEPETVYDGGFEESLSVDEVGFGWRIPRNLSGVTLSQDLSQPESGLKSVRVEFGGSSSPETPIISQLTIVQPLGTYRINFAARSHDLVTGGRPLVNVIDAATSEVLGRSQPLPEASSEWQRFSIAFTVSKKTSAVITQVQRENCSTSPCPSFGWLWLDSFSLEKVQ